MGKIKRRGNIKWSVINTRQNHNNNIFFCQYVFIEAIPQNLLYELLTTAIKIYKLKEIDEGFYERYISISLVPYKKTF